VIFLPGTSRATAHVFARYLSRAGQRLFAPLVSCWPASSGWSASLTGVWVGHFMALVVGGEL